MALKIGRTLVVGATSGIGRALVAHLGAAGVPVVGAGRRVENLGFLKGVLGLACDVRSHDDVQRLVSETVDALGGIDAIVYAAGISGVMPLGSTSMECWRDVYEVNLFGAVDLVQEALPHLGTSDSHGRVLLLTSDAAEMPYPGLVPYATSKAALAAFARGLRNERTDMHITEVVVGPTDDTGMLEQLGMDMIGEWAGRWAEEGFLRYNVQLPDDVVRPIAECLQSSAPPERLMAIGAAST